MAYARSRTVLYVVFKTLFVFTCTDCLFCKRQSAGPDFIRLCNNLQKSVQGTCMAERAVILASVAYDLAGLEYTGKILACSRVMQIEGYVLSSFRSML